MLLLEKLAEAKLKQALDSGELDNLPGQGKPMVLDDDSAIPPELRAAYRVLKNSGYLPAELVLRKEIKQVEELLLIADTHDQKKKLVLKLSLLKAKLK